MSVLLLTLVAAPGWAQSLQDLLQSIINAPGGRENSAGSPRRGPSRSAETAEIQRLLNAAGLSAGPPDGISGPSTTRAIRSFQQSQGAPVTGVLTQSEIDALRNAASGARPADAPAQAAPDIRAVQTTLANAGFDIGAVDGRWGPRSQTALDAFRRDAGLSAGGPPTGEDLALLTAPAGGTPLPDLAQPQDLPDLDLTTLGAGGESLTALPVVDRGMAFRLAWAGPGGSEAWVAILPPGAVPEPGIPAWPLGAASPAIIEAPRAAGRYEIVWIKVSDGSVRARRPLEVR